MYNYKDAIYILWHSLKSMPIYGKNSHYFKQILTQI